MWSSAERPPLAGSDPVESAQNPVVKRTMSSWPTGAPNPVFTHNRASLEGVGWHEQTLHASVVEEVSVVLVRLGALEGAPRGWFEAPGVAGRRFSWLRIESAAVD